MNLPLLLIIISHKLKKSGRGNESRKYLSLVLACAVLGVITVIGPFLGKNMLIPLTNVSALAFIFSCGMVALACLRMRFTEPDLPRPYEVPGGKFGISLAIVACSTIIGLLVIPFSPASLNMVEWSIVIGWLAVGLALMAFTNSRKK